MFCDTDDTIAAIASPFGGAYRGIVRVSGPQCVNAVSGVFSANEQNQSLAEVRIPSRLAGSINLGSPLGSVSADVLLWPGTRSYTRQPSAEIHAIGSPPLLDALLERLCLAGARLARPGEFTLRAFLAGRIDLTQAEAVLGVIDARDQRELSVALIQLAGGLTGPLFALRDRLLDLLAHLEAGLDFVEEDIEFISRAEIDRSLASAAQQIEALVGRMQARGIAGHLPRVVLCGAPNAGKSSLFNALCGHGAAIVSEIAGTTRDYLTVRITCGDRDIELIDTAGLGRQHSAASIEFAARSHSATQIESAAVLLHCVDANDSPMQPSSESREGGPSRITVWTKIDRCQNRPPETASTIRTSSLTGEGIAALMHAIAMALSSESADVSVVAGTATRCRESLVHAAESLRRARSAAGELGEEFVAAEVRSALDDLGRVAGAVYTDDVLDRIFSRFCIGK